MKQNKKKLLATVGVVGLSAVLLAVSALASTTNLNAYNRFKTALFSNRGTSKQLDNATANLSLNIKKGNQELVSVVGAAKHDNGNTSTEFNLNSSGVGITFNTWGWSEGTSFHNVYKTSDSDKYYQTIMKSNSSMKVRTETHGSPENMSPASEKFANAMIDLVMGDTKNYFTSNGDELGLRLEGAQIPEIAQLALAAVAEESFKDNAHMKSAANQPGHEKLQLLEATAKELTTLKDLRFEVIDVKCTMAAQTISKGSFTFQVSGVDVNGVRQQYTVEGAIEVTNINSTVADKLDISTIQDKLETNTIEGMGNHFDD